MILKILLLTLFLSGCIIAPPLPKLPEFKPAQQVCPTLVTSCPKLDLPVAIPKTVYIDIQEGKIIKVDAGGESLLREYAITRKAIKAWQK